MFVPSPGQVLFVIDFSALELRTLAAVCLKRYGESRLAQVFKDGIDAHTYAYCEIKGMSLDEFAEWKRKDPIARFSRTLRRRKAVSLAELKKAEQDARAQVEKAADFALSSPWPAAGEVQEQVWA